MKYKSAIITTVSLLIMTLLALPTIKKQGVAYDPGSPFEASNSRARFVQTEAIVENKSLALTREQAQFSSPDVVVHNGVFISIFTPGVSFVAIPFYMLGKIVGQTVTTTFLVGFIATIINTGLVILLAKKLGVQQIPSLISGAIYLFATNSLSYASTLTQHPLSTLFVLLALINSFEKRTLVNNIIFGYIFGWAVICDIPNIFLLMPAALIVLKKHIQIHARDRRWSIFFNTRAIMIVLGALPLLGALLWFNFKTTGSWATVPQFLGRDLTLEEEKQAALDASTTGPFPARHLPLNSRNGIKGAITLLISPERSWIFYSPILIIGLLGLGLATKDEKTKSISVIALATVVTNFTLYMVFGDPWGGWAFGPRYLIPSAAIAAAGVGIILQQVANNLLLKVAVLITCIYSIVVSLAGATTTNLIPPKVEAIHLAKPVPYTYEYNLDLIFKQNKTGSLIFSNLSSLASLKTQYLAWVWIVSLGFIGLFIVMNKKTHE